MKPLQVKIKKLNENAVIPAYAHATDAGLDLTAVENQIVPAHGRLLLHTGLAIDIPVGYCGLVTGRSGNTIKRGLVGQLGIVDSGYHGEIGIMEFNTTDEDIHIEVGERAGQIVIVPHLKADFLESDEFDTIDRKGGFGSTGK